MLVTKNDRHEEQNNSHDCVKHKMRKKFKFSMSEDKLLKQLVATYGDDNKWEFFATMFQRRTSRQLHDRWFYYLSPDINNEPFTDAEDLLLLEKQKEIGSHWVKLTKFFKNRTDTAIKNRWNVLQRRIKYDQKYRTELEKQNQEFLHRMIKETPLNMKIQEIQPVQHVHKSDIPDSHVQNSFGVDDSFASQIFQSI